MPATPSNPHDAYFRHVLARPADAASELRAALPKTLTDRIDWSRLQLQPGSFVSAELRSRYSDLLYRTRLDGHAAYIYLLIEHQSRSDRFMPLRILEYLVNIWNQHRNHHPNSRTLPPVLPLVVHSNSRGDAWNGPTDIADLFDLTPATEDVLRPHLPRLRFILDDIAAIDLPTLRARDLTPAARVMFTLHKIAPHNTDLGADMLDLIDDLRILSDGPHAAEELLAVMTYILIVGETSEHDLDPLIEQLGPRTKEAVVTTAERLRAEARVDMLIELLTVKFGAVPDTTTRTVRTATSEQVHTWLHRLITATSLDQIFA